MGWGKVDNVLSKTSRSNDYSFQQLTDGSSDYMITRKEIDHIESALLYTISNTKREL